MNYLSLDQLLLKIRSGNGLGVIIEGVTDGDDEWVYSQWFGHLAHLITFYPQDGYSRVYDAVAKLNYSTKTARGGHHRSRFCHRPRAESPV